MYGLDAAIWTALIVAALLGKPCDDDQGGRQQDEPRPTPAQTGGGGR